MAPGTVTSANRVSRADVATGSGSAALDATECGALRQRVGLYNALVIGRTFPGTKTVLSDGMGAERDRAFGGQERARLAVAAGLLLAARRAAIAIVRTDAAQVAALLRILLDRGGLAGRGAAAVDAHHVPCARNGGVCPVFRVAGGASWTRARRNASSDGFATRRSGDNATDVALLAFLVLVAFGRMTLAAAAREIDDAGRSFRAIPVVAASPARIAAVGQGSAIRGLCFRHLLGGKPGGAHRARRGRWLGYLPASSARDEDDGDDQDRYECDRCYPGLTHRHRCRRTCLAMLGVPASLMTNSM